MPTQRATPPGSVNGYQRKLGSKRAYHAIHWPRIRGLAVSAGVRLRANDTEISAAPWTLRLGKGLYFYSNSPLVLLARGAQTARCRWLLQRTARGSVYTQSIYRVCMYTCTSWWVQWWGEATAACGWDCVTH